MLPYSPIHHLLLAPVPGAAAPVPDALVLTSANRSDEPICFTDDDAGTAAFAALCDAVLDHDRPIHVPCDDSVVRVVDERGRLPIRRSRGYAPLPDRLGRVGPGRAGRGRRTEEHLLPHRRLARLPVRRTSATWAPGRRCARSSARWASSAKSAAEPVRLAADLHPGYHTRSWAERHAGDRPLDLVQHHHAHVVSLLAEHGRLGEPIVGVSFDGTGYGCDQTIWGGEILALGTDSHRFVRAGHLLPVPLPGGDAAVRNPWRMALSQLWMAGIDWTPDLAPVAAATADELRLTRSQLESGAGCVPCSSMGRLFDAVASLLGVRHRIDYEGQAAIELEALAAIGRRRSARAAVAAADGARRRGDRSGRHGAGAWCRRCAPASQPALLAAAFHRAVADAVAEVVTPGGRRGAAGGPHRWGVPERAAAARVP